jgi:hypothetical protein
VGEEGVRLEVKQMLLEWKEIKYSRVLRVESLNRVWL